MSPLWVLPVCVLAVGAVVVAIAARRLAAEVAALRPGLAALRDVAADAREVRASIDAAHERAAGLTAAPDRFRARLAELREARTGPTAR